MKYSYTGGLMLEQLNHLTKNIYRVAWSLKPENRVGVVGDIRRNVVDGVESNIFIVDVVNTDPFLPADEYVTDRFFANQNEVDQLEVGELVTWGVILPFLKKINPEYLEEISAVKSQIDLLYQKYLSEKN